MREPDHDLKKSEHAEIIALVDQTLSDMRKRNETVVRQDEIGDKVADLLDPMHRAPHLAAFASRMMCREYARARLRNFNREMRANQQGAFELEPYCPTGNGDEYVLRLEMTLEERAAFSQALGNEIETKAEHRKAFDAETRKLIGENYFDERGRPKNSRRNFDNAA
ncbi:hypothetical protein [Paraburkholderia caffeinilytica]|uniref:hypothetical protein n=1 Tax=Paraburkholderia caffeinilytica TaxID=1761016 RepID=UPI003D9FBF7A